MQQSLGGPRLRTELPLAWGVTLLALGLLVWLAPGRIDMTDGQLRYEVAKNLLLHASPDLRDPELPGMSPGAVQRSSYALGASLAGLPGVWLGQLLGSELLAQFLFSLATPLFGALLAGLFVLAYRLLGLTPRASVGWALVAVFGTQLLPTALSVFDQVQEAVLLLAAAVFLLRGCSVLNYACAGLLAGLLAAWQTAYVVILPPLFLALLPWRDLWRSRPHWRQALTRQQWLALAAFALALCVGPGLALLYNQYRFGSAAQIAASGGAPRLTEPLSGLAVLLLSPGKSVFLYSPVVVLAVLGARALGREQPVLMRFVWAAVGSQLILVSSLLFCSGDWCWGPRYLSVTMPLLLLAAPWGARRMRVWVWCGLIGVSVLIQGLAISLDHHRFFFERNLAPEFWVDRSFYFSNSALLARPAELWLSPEPTFPKPGPKTQQYPAGQPVALFPGPYPELPTYATFGPAPDGVATSDTWHKQFPGLFWPRPWPLWSRKYGLHQQTPALRVIELTAWLSVLWGGLLLTQRLRARQPSAT